VKKAKVILILFLLVVFSVGAYIMFGSYSSGYRAGTIIKLSHKGVAFKTYEGQLNLGMVLSDDPGGAAVSNIWDFSVPASRKETVTKLENAMLSGQRVKVHYEEKFLKLPWRGDTKYMVTDVEEQH
jgi:hypothetical protein